MASIKELIENKSTLAYNELCTSLIGHFGLQEKINFESVLPAAQQQELFGGEMLRLIAEHPNFKNQKDIRPVSLKKGSVSQLLFFFVRLNDETIPKSIIQRITTRFVRGSDANRFIVWFFGNKNETELKVVLSGKEGKKVVLKTLPFGVNQPYYKTYDFILNEVQKQVNRLFVEPVELWKTLWKAFDISIVNRNFYNEIKFAFDKLIEQLKQKGNPFTNDEDRVQFAIRLIGRIIFCWFLKRKGILKDDAVSSAAVHSLSSGNYYHELLEVLFFDVLNTPEKERRTSIPKTISQYPFLNGGLFDAQDTDYKENYLLQIGNSWFLRFFADTLEKYNFTVDENSSSNAEIAIDPEMLGRIFENLLAEQNPETGESARKATGSFYTPREIVDYMVEQSISEYLKNYFLPDENSPVENTVGMDIAPLETNLFGVVPNQQLKLTSTTAAKPKTEKQNTELAEALEDFVHTQHWSEKIDKENDSQKILEALNKVKVLDPACGSGAFPIGVLQKIVALKQQLQPKAKPYKLKLETIQNSIFGVDIQPLAVELSRLRCWLSLVVDEEAEDIKPLPNLDFKFVCANSLIDVPMNDYTKTQLKNTGVLKELEQNVSNYFSPDFKSKKKLRENIKKNIAEIIRVNDKAVIFFIEQMRREKNIASESKKRQREVEIQKHYDIQGKWKSYENIFRNHKVEFFSIPYFFPAAKEGFDIVIANPPYFSLSTLTNENLDSLKTQNFFNFSKTSDIYCLFFEVGVRFLKTNGIITFITSNQWLQTNYGKILRKFFQEQTNPLGLLNFGGFKVFESATVDTSIFIGKRQMCKYNLAACHFKNDFTPDQTITDYFNQKKIILSNFSYEKWSIASSKNIDLTKKIFTQAKLLMNWNIQINRGILTGLNDAFIIDEKTKDEIILKEPQSSEIIKKVLRGRDVHKHYINWANLYLIYIPWHFPIHKDNSIMGATDKAEPLFKKKFPTIYNHLLKYKDQLSARNQDEVGVRYEWFALQRYGSKFWQNFDKPKIIYPETTVRRSEFYYDTEKFILDKTCFMITGDEIKYLNAILPSKLIEWYLETELRLLGKNSIQYSKQYVERIPIAETSNQQSFTTLSDQILTAKKTNPLADTTALERQIDIMVYHLYNLTLEEARVIDAGLGEEEWEKYRI